MDDVVRDLWPHLNGGELIGLTAVLCGSILGTAAVITKVVTSHMRRLRETDLRGAELAFKKDLLDRGMSPQEIKQLLEATANPPQQSG